MDLVFTLEEAWVSYLMSKYPGENVTYAFDFISTDLPLEGQFKTSGEAYDVVWSWDLTLIRHQHLDPWHPLYWDVHKSGTVIGMGLPEYKSLEKSVVLQYREYLCAGN